MASRQGPDDARGSSRLRAVEQTSFSQTPRLLLTIGQDEGEEYIRQLNEFAVAWRPFLPHLTATVIPATNHFSMRAALDDPDSDISRLIRREMMDKPQLGSN